MATEKLCFDLYDFDEVFDAIGTGPWLDEPDAVLWRSEHCAFPCVTVRCPANYTWVGGIGVPATHAFWGRSLDDVFGPYDEERNLPLYFAGELDDADFEMALPLQTLCQPMRIQDVWWFFFGPNGMARDGRPSPDPTWRQEFLQSYLPSDAMERWVDRYAEYFGKHWRGEIAHHWTLTASKVRERGWTEEMIDEFLGEPDERKPNPKYRSPYPMRLYLQKRVLAAERRMKVARRLGRVEPDYSWWHFDPDEQPGWLRCLPLGRQDAMVSAG